LNRRFFENPNLNMTEGAKILRLSKVAKEFNIGTNTIIEFLSKKGFSVENNPNSKIPSEAYDLLFKEFQSEKTLKEATQKVGLNLLKRESVSIDGVKTAEEDAKKAAAQKQEADEKELFIKDMKAHSEPVTESGPGKEVSKVKEAPAGKEKEKKPTKKKRKRLRISLYPTKRPKKRQLLWWKRRLKCRR
jgi:translation initiation factor IF-2